MDRTTIDELPVTSLHLTLVDLAEALPEPELAKAVHEAEVKRLLDLRRLVDAQRRWRRHARDHEVRVTPKDLTTGRAGLARYLEEILGYR